MNRVYLSCNTSVESRLEHAFDFFASSQVWWFMIQCRTNTHDILAAIMGATLGHLRYYQRDEADDVRGVILVRRPLAGRVIPVTIVFKFR